MYYRIEYKDRYGNKLYLSKKYNSLRIAKGIKIKFEKRGLQEVTIKEYKDDSL